MKSSREHGQINDVEYRYVEKIFEFDNKIAKEIMTPRTEVEAIDMSDSLGIIMRQLKQEEYTRDVYKRQDIKFNCLRNLY